jgi:transposase InsO family protein
MLKISHKRTRPYTPRTNGKAERFVQNSLREWAYAKLCNHLQDP